MHEDKGGGGGGGKSQLLKNCDSSLANCKSGYEMIQL